MNRWIISGGAVVLIVLTVVFFPRKNDVVITESQDEMAVADSSADELYEKAAETKEERDLVKTGEIYQEIIENHPDYENVEQVQSELEALNLEMILSNRDVPGTVIHEVELGDTLGKLAREYNTTVELIQVKNNLDSDIIRIGQRLKIWQGDVNILVDKSQNILLLKDGNRVVKTYQVATGEDNSTPVGTFEVVTKLVDPVWFKAGAIIPPESSQNVLGSRWMGFDLPGYGIHGTTEPDTVGQQVTAGCVRMRNEEVEELYSIVPKKTKVVVIN